MERDSSYSCCISIFMTVRKLWMLHKKAHPLWWLVGVSITVLWRGFSGVPHTPL